MVLSLAYDYEWKAVFSGHSGMFALRYSFMIGSGLKRFRSNPMTIFGIMPANWPAAESMSQRRDRRSA
jgi:hypothetical protein